MADWTTLIDSAVGVGGIPSGTTVTALRDNPVAIAEGATGAPRIWIPALERLEAGDSIRSRNDTAGSAGFTDRIIAHSMGIIQIGTLRCRIEKTGGTGVVFVERVRSGSATTLGSSSATGVLTVDAAVVAGDLINIRAGNGGGAVNYQNARMSTNGQDLWPGTSARIEGNRSV